VVHGFLQTTLFNCMCASIIINFVYFLSDFYEVVNISAIFKRIFSFAEIDGWFKKSPKLIAINTSLLIDGCIIVNSNYFWEILTEEFEYEFDRCHALKFDGRMFSNKQWNLCSLFSSFFMTYFEVFFSHQLQTQW